MYACPSRGNVVISFAVSVSSVVGVALGIVYIPGTVVF